MADEEAEAQARQRRKKRGKRRVHFAEVDDHGGGGGSGRRRSGSKRAGCAEDDNEASSVLRFSRTYNRVRGMGQRSRSRSRRRASGSGGVGDGGAGSRAQVVAAANSDHAQQETMITMPGMVQHDNNNSSSSSSSSSSSNNNAGKSSPLNLRTVARLGMGLARSNFGAGDNGDVGGDSERVTRRRQNSLQERRERFAAIKNATESRLINASAGVEL